MSTAPRQLHFAEFSLDPRSGELRRGGRVVPLERQPSIVLACLVATPGKLVSRPELAAAVWTDAVHVSYEDGLNYCIRQVRAALGDDPKSPRFIETVPKRGYRFIAPVSDRPAHRRLRGYLMAGFAAAALLVTIVESRPNNHHQVMVSVVTALHDLIY
jgi:DNA-binding winged helix-turn-helix (wHTH) protein